MTVYAEDKSAPLTSALAALGRDIEAYRLSRNITQRDLAQQAGLGLSSVMRLEGGAGSSLDTLLRVLRALGCADRLGLLVPDAKVSPLDPASAKGQRRQRARAQRHTATLDPAPWAWGAEGGGA